MQSSPEAANMKRKSEVERTAAMFSALPQSEFQFQLARFISDHIAALESRIATLEQAQLDRENYEAEQAEYLE